MSLKRKEYCAGRAENGIIPAVSMIVISVRRLSPIAACAVALACTAAFAEKQPYSRYESIVERQMFGKPPPGFDPEKMPSEVSRSGQKELTKEQEKLQSSIHFSVINVTPDGATAVGFTDNSNPKEPVHYYLKVGEKRNGWEVREANAETASMTIARGDIEVSLTIGENSGKGGGTTAARNGSAAAGDKGDVSLPRRGLMPGGGLLGSGSLRARRQERELQRQKAAQEEADRTRQLVAEAAEEAAEKAAEKAREEARKEERAATRQQLMTLQDELRKMRKEAKPAEQEKQEEGNEEDNS